MGLSIFCTTLTSTVASGNSGPSNTSITRSEESEVLFEEDFEDQSLGTVPSNFVLAGNEDQKVTDQYAATGSQSYRMSGSHGGCWQAIARTPVELADEMRIQGRYRLQGGTEGCHTGSGKISLIDEIGDSWRDGNGPSLLKFYPDGRITSAGDSVGEHTTQEWVQFDLIYQHDTEANEVIQKCRIGDSEWQSTTRGAHSAEDDLVGLQINTNDFTVLWDEIRIEKYTNEDDDGYPTIEDYTNEEGIVDTPGLFDAVADWRSNTIDRKLLNQVIKAWRNGTPI